MPKKKSNLSRRNFLKVTGLTTVGAIIAPFDQSAKASEEEQMMPTIPFGKSGMKVPILSFGNSTLVQTYAMYFEYGQLNAAQRV